MSNSDRPPPPPVPQQRSGCLTAFMVIVGIILLLPGLCALIVGGMELSSAHFDQSLISFIMLGLLAGTLGVVLIWNAVRGSRS
jgi:hypothetical protein